MGKRLLVGKRAINAHDTQRAGSGALLARTNDDTTMAPIPSPPRMTLGSRPLGISTA
jgi:hypothetical protein